MQTTAGTYALVDSVVPGDATVIKKLRAKGAIIMGKTNLSELSAFMGSLPSGCSAVGGQCTSAYVLGGSPIGSSSGSAVALSAGFAAGSIGSDTSGSLIWPASRAALFAIRPSMGLVSRHGVVPVALSMDTIGPMGKTAYDTALLLTHMAGPDENDDSSEPFQPFVRRASAPTLIYAEYC